MSDNNNFFMGLRDNILRFCEHVRSFDSSKPSYHELLEQKAESMKLLEQKVEFRQIVDNLDKRVNELRFSREEIIEMSRSGEHYSNALKEWQDSEVNPLKKKVNDFVVHALGSFIGVIIENLPEGRRVPFVYHSVGSSQLYYTLAVPEILGISDKNELTLRRLLDKISKGSFKGFDDERAGISNSKSGFFSRLNRNLKKESGSVMYKVHPFHYGDSCIGEGLRLYNKKTSRRIKRESIDFLRIVRDMSRDYKVELSKL